MAENVFENLTGAGITEEDESKEIKSMCGKLEKKDSLNGDDDDVLLDKENNGLESPLNLDPLLNNDDNLVPVENLQDDLKSKSITHSTQKHNQAIMPNLNDKSGSRKRLLDMFSPTYGNLLDSWKKAHEISDNAHLEWDWERWNEEKVRKLEKQQFEEVKLQKQMEFDAKKNAKKHELEKEKWNRECKLKEKQCQMDLTLAAL
ncbi:hypothetical protein O181_069801 [Austropuccinia psidii MF-1]|uniref:Uncharacterized protein n=1 Tax=Austropuccinia psidii MF-1 TaxID=1389203 RepID=A0A9Q3EXG8_9BASI|nr:hypothetical protein [Austropuccinia psidii MF-1]